MIFRIFIISFVLEALLFAQGGTAGDPSSKNSGPVPIFDPSSESVSFMGQTFVLRDTRIHLHFESYLASEDYKLKEARAYYNDVNKIKQILSIDSGYTNRVGTAYRHLKEAARFKGDHNVSESLGAAVVSAVSAMETIEKRNETERKLLKERSDNYRKMKLIETRTNFDVRRKVGDGSPVPNNIKKNRKSTEYKELVRRQLEIEVLRKKNAVVGVAKLAQAKIEFQAILLQLMMQRRFEHVIMGCRFYIHIFKPKSAQLDLQKNSMMADFFKSSVGVQPTIAGLEAFAIEIILKVRNLVNQAENHISRGELHSASNRLLEAYAIGEHLVFIQTIPIEKKSRLYQYNRTSNDLLNAIDARNFDLAFQFNDRLKSLAKDYRHTKIEAYIRGFTAASDAHALAAFSHMANGDEEAMFKEIERSKVLWPLNPKLDEIKKLVDKEIYKTQSQLSDYQALCEQFDSLVLDQKYITVLKEENWRAFATQFNIENDEGRLVHLREISKKFEPAIIGLKMSAVLLERNEPILAWEKVDALTTEFPNSAEIKDKAAEYRQHAARYVDIIEHARKLVDHGHYGSALSHYLKAQEIHPTGSHSKDGISHLLKLRSQ